jgi:hypothetical protein
MAPKLVKIGRKLIPLAVSLEKRAAKSMRARRFPIQKQLVLANQIVVPQRKANPVVPVAKLQKLTKLNQGQ